jgi:hemolysin activation/secretion protein
MAFLGASMTGASTEHPPRPGRCFAGNRAQGRVHGSRLAARGLAVAVVALGLWPASPVFAQAAVERHLPPAEPQPGPAIRINQPGSTPASSAPLGVALKGVHLIGQSASPETEPPVGITGAAPGLPPGRLARALTRLLGQPLSLQLAQEVQQTIARLYREAGFPFVSVTLPPQQITSGVLQVRLIRFALGTVIVNDANAADATAVRAGIRADPNVVIDARKLNEDIDWLNRIPYRHVEGVFAPGAAEGLSNLTLDVTTSKPWQVSAGWSNSGSKATSIDRFTVGAGIWLPALNGTTVSYQLTGSDDFWTDPGQALSLEPGHFADYLSHAARIVIPTSARQELEISPDYVATHQALDRFTAAENTVLELPIIYRSAVSNILPGHYWGDLYGGAEFKSLARTSYFSGVKAASGSAGLFQLVLGWSGNFADGNGFTSIDARLKADPGGIVSGNDAATWNAFSNGRVTDVNYVYGALDVTRVTRLPGGFSWVSLFSGQWSETPLPDTERLSLGGATATRAYYFDDASVDRGFVWRNEFRLPTSSPLAAIAKVDDDLSPYVFADLGYGQDLQTLASMTLTSLGAGVDYTVGNNVRMAIDTGVALNSAGATRAGDWKLQAALNFSY